MKARLLSGLAPFRWSQDVATKDRAATLWAESATHLTGQDWRYVKVLQREFERLQPAMFEDIAYVGQMVMSRFEDASL